MHRLRLVTPMLLTLLWFLTAAPVGPAEAAAPTALALENAIGSTAPWAAIATTDGTVRTGPSTQAKALDVLDVGDVFPVVGMVKGEQVSEGNEIWLETAYGHYVYSGVAKLQQGGSKYIDVDRSTHTALAVEDGAIVYSAPVVLGQPGWPTPVGQFTITYQVARQTMDSTALGIPTWASGGFSYPNVRYVQYVDGGFALHANYWAPASAFGQADSSHGCVGMLFADAEFFWDFADIGTPVYIHD